MSNYDTNTFITQQIESEGQSFSFSEAYYEEKAAKEVFLRKNEVNEEIIAGHVEDQTRLMSKVRSQAETIVAQKKTISDLGAKLTAKEKLVEEYKNTRNLKKELRRELTSKENEKIENEIKLRQAAAKELRKKVDELLAEVSTK